jgi:murein L,D-transpeptidase YafK
MLYLYKSLGVLGNKNTPVPFNFLRMTGMKNLFTSALLVVTGLAASAQQSAAFRSDVSYSSFIDYQKTFPRPDESFKRKQDTLQKQFEAKKLAWPAKYIYVRSFKYDSQMEVWVKNDIKDQFKLFKTYKVCALVH